jgi:hypothetical protein
MVANWWLALGDAVRFEALERVDLIDADGMQDLRRYAEMLNHGGAWGQGPGCLSAFVQNYSANGTTVLVSVGPFQFGYTYDARTSTGARLADPGPPPPSTRSPFGDGKIKAQAGLVVTHDPSDSGQAPLSTFDVTSFTAYIRSVWFGEGGAWPATFDPNLWPYLWARPVMVDATSDARRQWNTGTHTEAAVTIETRRRVRVEFMLSVDEPSVPLDSSGVPEEPTWVKIGRVAGWEDLSAAQYNVDGEGAGPALPRIYPLAALDGGTWPAFVQGEIWDESENPPVLGQWAWSQYLSPFPAWWNVSGHEGYLQSGGTVLNRGFNTPATLGLGSAFGILADRLRAHLVGADSGANGTAGFWERPTHGIKWLIDKTEDLLLQVAQLADDINTLEADVEAIAGQPRMVAWGNYPWKVATAGWDDVQESGLNPVPYPQGSGVVRVYIDSGLSAKSAVVSASKNLDDDYYGNSRAAFDKTKGGYKVSLKGFGNDGSDYVEVYCEGPDHTDTHSTFIWTYGSFTLALYADPLP